MCTSAGLRQTGIGGCALSASADALEQPLHKRLAGAGPRQGRSPNSGRARPVAETVLRNYSGMSFTDTTLDRFAALNDAINATMGT